MGCKRARNDSIDFDAAMESLKCLASLRTPGFDWAVREYGKSRRSQGPDNAGICKYRVLRCCILKLAPGGHPSLVDLRRLWIDLHEANGIKTEQDVSLEAWANQAGDAIRLMCRHLVSIKKSNSSYMKHGISDMLDLLVLDDEPSLPISSPSAPSEETVSRVVRPRISDESSVASVIICGAFCNCVVCREDILVPSQDTVQPPPDEYDDSVSEDAHNNHDSVPAQRGKIRKMFKKRPAAAANVPKVRRRLNEKTKASPSSGHEKAIIKIGVRHNPPHKAEAYLTHGGKYLISVRKARGPNYMDIMKDIQAQLLKKENLDTGAFKELAGQILQEHLRR